jgi:hypothetical protein
VHPATYRILVEGVLPQEEVQELVGLRVIERSAGATALEGTVVDQSALLGTVARLEALGCRVHDLYVIEPVPAASDSP